MPELPEVETVCRGIRPYLLGKSIQAVIVRAPKLRWPIPKRLNAQLKNQTILQVERRAKYILIHTAVGTLIVHLGMSGRIQIINAETKIGKHDHFDLQFSDCIMRLTDPRRFGAVLWQAPHETHPLLAKIGPEPLGKAFDGAYFFEHLKKRSISIKSALLDQKLVAGIGNIYACESLFLSFISPFREARSLSLEACNELVRQIKKVLRAAIKKGGTTLQDFTQSNGKPGYFKQELFVYGRASKPCHKCKTLIMVKKIGQRATFYCPSCQI